jgi:hypothetical protein
VDLLTAMPPLSDQGNTIPLSLFRRFIQLNFNYSHSQLLSQRISNQLKFEILNRREGLSTRTAAASSDEIQLRIDPVGDLDDEITGLFGQVKRLRNVMFLFPNSL